MGSASSFQAPMPVTPCDMHSMNIDLGSTGVTVGMFVEGRKVCACATFCDDLTLFLMRRTCENDSRFKF